MQPLGEMEDRQLYAKLLGIAFPRLRSQFTRLFAMRMIDTLKECDVTGVTRLAGTSWDEAWGVMNRAVNRGLTRKERRVPAHIGIDEKSVGKGHEYESFAAAISSESEIGNSPSGCFSIC
jgi:hypothetical protein